MNNNTKQMFEDSVSRCVTEEDMDMIVEALVEKCKRGTLSAIKLFYEYTLGRPQQAVTLKSDDLKIAIEPRLPPIKKTLSASAESEYTVDDYPDFSNEEAFLAPGITGSAKWLEIIE